MPRKQRFKPSRKPKVEQATVSSPGADERKEIRPQGGDVERKDPIVEPPRDIDDDHF